MAHCRLHVISALCVARGLFTIAPGPLERTCWRQFAAQWGDCKKSRIAPLNAITIMFIFMRLLAFCCCFAHLFGSPLGYFLLALEAAGFFVVVVVVGWLLNVPATCECISGTDLLRQFYVLPHWDRSCRPNFLFHPVTVYWHRANQSQHWPHSLDRRNSPNQHAPGA